MKRPTLAELSGVPPGPSSQAERNRRHREKARKAGIVSVTVEIPIERRDELRAIAADMRRGKG